jgi:hypothetical protein
MHTSTWFADGGGSTLSARGPTVHCAGSHGDTRIRQTADGTHVDLRGLEPPEPMVTVLRLIDLGEVDNVLIAHFDREPIFLYPELDDRGWTHEVVPHECGSCTDGVVLRIARYGP